MWQGGETWDAPVGQSLRVTEFDRIKPQFGKLVLLEPADGDNALVEHRVRESWSRFVSCCHLGDGDLGIRVSPGVFIISVKHVSADRGPKIVHYEVPTL